MLGWSRWVGRRNTIETTAGESAAVRSKLSPKKWISSEKRRSRTQPKRRYTGRRSAVLHLYLQGMFRVWIEVQIATRFLRKHR